MYFNKKNILEISDALMSIFIDIKIMLYLHKLQFSKQVMVKQICFYFYSLILKALTV